MRNSIPDTPFPTTGYFGPAYFCDRVEETKILIDNIKGGLSTSLVAVRRLGKTALIKHVLYKLRAGYKSVYLDILPTENSNDLLNYLANAAAVSFPERSSFGKRIWGFLKTLRPVIGLDPYTGAPNLSFAFKSDDSREHISDLLHLMEESDKPVIIALDEFQQILNYPEKNVDAWLRSTIQSLKNVVFVFSGSQQHLMSDLFANPSKPFFQSTLFLQLQKIAIESYASFIQKHFTQGAKNIDDSVVLEILNWADLHTYYVQLLCNRIYRNQSRTIDDRTWKEEAARLLKEHEFVFYGYREMLTPAQWSLLKAIALEGRVYQPSSSAFLTKYGLGNQATVYRAMEALMNKELLYRQFDESGESYYAVYNILFRRWLETI